MNKFWVIGPRQLNRIKLAAAAVIIAATAALIWWFAGGGVQSVMGRADSGVRTFHLVTGEFKAVLSDGTEIEAYRWDPGMIYVKQGDTVQLNILGVNGASHPFVIDGLNVKGEVRKGQETVVTFKADKPGIYRIICLTHPDMEHHGPMIGYIVVDK